MYITATDPKQLPAVIVMAIIPYRLNSIPSKYAFTLLSIIELFNSQPMYLATHRPIMI
ncbi:MAG: hypothetical protein RIF46_08405 [Cyclobacteriaceae bacterium]